MHHSSMGGAAQGHVCSAGRDSRCQLQRKQVAYCASIDCHHAGTLASSRQGLMPAQGQPSVCSNSGPVLEQAGMLVVWCCTLAVNEQRINGQPPLVTHSNARQRWALTGQVVAKAKAEAQDAGTLVCQGSSVGLEPHAITKDLGALYNSTACSRCCQRLCNFTQIGGVQVCRVAHAASPGGNSTVAQVQSAGNCKTAVVII